MMNTSSFSDHDVRDIHELGGQIAVHLNPNEAHHLQALEDREGVASDAYLNEVTRLYKKYLLGVIERREGRSKHATGGRKPGAHSEGKHR